MPNFTGCNRYFAYTKLFNNKIHHPMKKVFFFFFSLLLFVFTNQLSAQCTSTISLETQASVDDFVNNYGCSIIEANLIIGNINTSNPVDNLLGLTSITSIQGDLRILGSFNSNLATLNGLQNLTSIGGDLDIMENKSLTNLDGLQNLTSIGGNILIYENEVLTNIEGLQNITSVEGKLNIEWNESLSSLNGLQGIASIAEDLDISFNFDLTDIDGLQNLTSIGGNILIENNNELTNIDGLQNIGAFGQGIRIEENNKLTNIDGLQNITSIGEYLTIKWNDKLNNLLGLQNTTSIGGSLNIYSNDALTSLGGLQNITSVGGSLSIFNNDNLTNLNGLQNITSVGSLSISNNDNISNLDELQNITNPEGYLSISLNQNLTSLDALHNITAVGGNLSISSNDNLTNLDGLHNITSVGSLVISEPNLISLSELQNITFVGENIQLHNNHSLTNFDGLHNITSIENFMLIFNNENLNSLFGLQNLTSVGGNLRIYNNEQLSNLNGLHSLTTIGADLRVSNNTNLISLDLNNVTSIGGYVEIYENPSLAACCSVLPILEETLQDVTIYDNLPSCNSTEEILVFCENYSIQAISFFDENENGIFDPNEYNVQQSFILEPSEQYSFSDQMGTSYFYLDSYGEYEIFLNNNNPLWEFSGTENPIQISFLDSTFSDTLHYFPMTPVANFTIQKVDLSSSITRCNQETNYWLTYTNDGTTINDGSIELIPDDLGTLVSADPPADSTANGKLYWFYEDLYPTHSEQIHLIYAMPGVDALGEQINFEANIQTNEGFGDHKAIIGSELICAYDPNDKLNTPSGYGDDNYTLFGDTLEYTIRFQNTGNDTAFTVIIEDELSSHLNLNTFRPIASSHNVESLIDINSRLATFTFNDIYLPDSFVNEPASHGFIKYRILGNQGMNENTDIKNTASIFFDQNPPIVTNTVNNRMVSELPSLPILTASSDELIFEEIALDESSYAPQILVIENQGELTLHIEEFYFEDANFNSRELQHISVEGQESKEIPIYFEPNEPGNYQSELTLKSNVGNLSIALLGTATLGTGISSLSNTQFQIFPNPNNGVFHLKSLRTPILSYQIINNQGTTVFIDQTNSYFASVNLSHLQKGLYFVKLQTKEGTFVEKVFVQ